MADTISGDGGRMPAHASGPRLVIVCGLPGAGRTALTRKMRRQLGAVRFCPDEWMEELAINLWDVEAGQG